jgi:hypothetical protein
VRVGLAARTAGTRRPILMPVSAASLLERWSRGDVGSIEASMRELAAAAAAPDRVPRWRRAVPLALAGAPALVLIGGAVGVLPQFDAAVTPERIEIYSLLEAVGPSASNAPAPADRESMEIYIAGRYGDQLRDDRFWSAAPMQGSLRRHRETAERVLRAHPSVPLAAVEAARASIAPSLDRIRSNYERNVRTSLPRVRALLVAALTGVGLGVPLVLGLVSALVVPGGILGRLVGLAVVTADGAAIGRARSVARVLVGWSPALAWFAYLGPSPIDRSLAMPVSPLVPGAIVLGVLAAGAAWAIVTPERGPHDRVTGTWLMPR